MKTAPSIVGVLRLYKAPSPGPLNCSCFVINYLHPPSPGFLWLQYYTTKGNEFHRMSLNVIKTRLNLKFDFLGHNNSKEGNLRCVGSLSKLASQYACNSSFNSLVHWTTSLASNKWIVCEGNGYNFCLTRACHDCRLSLTPIALCLWRVRWKTSNDNNWHPAWGFNGMCYKFRCKLKSRT